MDYTTLTLCKQPAHIYSVKDDTLLASLITQISRDLDRYCSGSTDNSSDDYFGLSDVANEVVQGNIGNHGDLLFYPRKPIVNSVSAVAYRFVPNDAWVTVDPALCIIEGISVKQWLQTVYTSTSVPNTLPQKCYVQVSYNGGFATSAAGLPQDLVLSATQLVVRAYHEYESGLSDAVGTDETGVYMYNKSIPTTIRRKLEPFRRSMGWRRIG